MRVFNPDYLSNTYSPKNALALALACEQAYRIKHSKDLEGVQGLLKQWGFSEMTVLNKQLGKTIDTQGFIAANEDRILITFSGSESLPDWVTNFISVTDPGPFPDSRVHEGFQDALFPVLLTLTRALHIYNPTYHKSIWITGHSLGGALAVLLGSMFVAEGIPVSGIYTFGAPRVGDPRFANTLDQKLAGSLYRVVNEGDLVPHLPPQFLGFLHSGKTILFKTDGSRVDEDVAVWTQFQEGIGAWMSHITKQDLAIRDYHLLDSEHGYIPKLSQDLLR